MKKKLMALLLCSVTAVMLAACGSSNEGTTSEEKVYLEDSQIQQLFTDPEQFKGKYAKLENAVKSYYKDLYEIQFKSEDAITNSAYDKMLLSDNLISDGPDFENSCAELATLLQTLQDCSVQYSELITAEKAKSYFDETKLSAKYETLFNDSVSVASSETENIYLTSLENSEKSVSAVSGVIDYLAQTKNEWSVEGDKLVFNTKDAAEKYNEAVSALGDAQSNK